MTAESKKWDSLKAEYLRKVEKALSSVKHPRSKEVLEDVSSHLDRRFAELEPQQRTWENFQTIITEMGPASDYAELIDTNAGAPGRGARQKYLLWLSFAVIVVAAAVLLLMAMHEDKVGYIVTFEPVEPFEPQTARELLGAFNENHPPDTRTHHFRTSIHGDKLQGHICVDTAAAKQAIVNMINKSDKLLLVAAKAVSRKDLERYYALDQPSLSAAVSAEKPRSLPESPNQKLLDERTLRQLRSHEEFSAEWFKLEEAYEVASESEKNKMVKQWIADATGDDFEKMTRAIAALGNVAAHEALDLLMNIAQKPKRGNRPRWMAVRALGRIGDTKAVPLLINLLDHYNSDTRLYAKVALCEITGVYFGDSKQKWSDWAQTQGIEVKQMDIGPKYVPTTRQRTYPARPATSRNKTVSRSGTWPDGNCTIGGSVYREASHYRSIHHGKVCLSSEEFGSWLIETDDGRFDFEYIPAGVYTLRTAETFGYKETCYNPENKPVEQPSFRLKDSERRWQIQLKVQPVRPYIQISGRVLDENGKPVTNNRGFLVDAWLQMPQGRFKGRYRPIASSGLNQRDGSYLLEELDGRPVYVMVRDFNAYNKDNPYPPCYYPGTFSRSEATPIASENGESVENADIRLARTGGLVLQGIVTDENTSEPVPEAMVVIRHADMIYDLFPVYTDDNGRYRTEALGEGTFLAYVDAMHKGFVKTRRLFNIEPGTQEKQLNFTLKPGVRISGKFKDENGNPWQVERAHGSASIPGAPHVGNASNFPYYNKYAPPTFWGTTVFYNEGEGDQPSSMMVYPTKDSFLIQAMMPGKTRIRFSPREPSGKVSKIVYNGKDISETGLVTEPGQKIEDVTIVVGTSGGSPPVRAQTSDKLQFSLQDAFGREVHSQDYKGVPIFLEFGACW